ncbi:MAG: HlyD family efflux transporter periplasmic adaptor subunit [Phycisphaeraceae bacterium]|nr:HlyD family efflux transporter periplasmic adaptor subunit [Phycisphaeraceae bacterium]
MSSDDNAELLDASGQFQTLERHADDSRNKDARSDLIEAVPPLYMRSTIYLFVAVIIVSLLLTYIAKVYVIIPATGIISPESQNVVIEAESAGIVTKLLVTPGDNVMPGQILMELRQDAAGVNLATLHDQLDIHLSNREKAHKAILIVNQLIAQPNLVLEKSLDFFKDAGAAMVYTANLKTSMQRLEQARLNLKNDGAEQQRMMASQVALQQTTIENLKRNQAPTEKLIKTLEISLARKQQNLDRNIQLAQERVITETQVSQARDQVLSAQNNLNQQRQQLAQLKLSISQAFVEIGTQKNQLAKQKRGLKSQLETAQLSYDKAIADLASSIATFEQVLQTTDATIAEARGKLRMQENTINKLTIKSPVAGEITALNFNSAGQSVGVGARVAVIIPTDARPIVMVTVANKDIAGVKEGIPARVKVDAYPFRQFGTVEATVTRVFPLADKPEFAVRLRLSNNFIIANDRQEPLEPGLTVEVDLLTERKRILELIFKKMR